MKPLAQARSAALSCRLGSSITEHSALMTGKKMAVPTGTLQLRLAGLPSSVPPRNHTSPC